MSHQLIIPSFKVLKLLPASLGKESPSSSVNVDESTNDNSALASDAANPTICSDEVWLSKLLHWVETTQFAERKQPNEARH